MTREVSLVPYLPPFMQEYKEPVAALEAEDPEFIIVWKAVDRILYNHFITTADEYGISRFENLLGITPLKEESLEMRRTRVQNMWFNTTPYTFRVFLEKLTALCGDSDFTVTKQFSIYRIDITTDLESPGQVDELDRLIEAMMPCNMVVVSVNKLPCEPQGNLYMAGTVCCVDYIQISDKETDS